MKSSFRGILFGAMFGVVALVPAHASLLFNIKCTAPGTCGSTVGTITLSQIDAFTVQVLETVALPNGIVETGTHSALTFDIAADPSITISNLTAGFTVGNTTSGTFVSNPSFGSYDYSIHCPICGNGSNNPQHSLSFDVQILGGLTHLSINDFISNGNSFFATDLFANGFTGVWGDDGGGGSTQGTPEPVSFVLLGTGLGLLGLTRTISNRRRLSAQK